MEFETQCFIATEMHYLLDFGSLVLTLSETAVKWSDTWLVKGINGLHTHQKLLLYMEQQAFDTG